MAINDPNNGPWGKAPGSGGSNRPSGSPPPGKKSGGPEGDWQRKLQALFDEHFSGNHGRQKLFGAVALGLLLLWLVTGIYQVQSGVQGVVLRFGHFNRMVGAGPHYHLPEPFEKVFLVNTQLVRKESFGASADSSVVQADGAPAALPDNLMLTGDENVIDITFDVQWNIKDAQAFLFNVNDPLSTVRNVSESAMREIIGQTGFTQAQTAGKSQIEQQTKELIQATLDEYKSGIRIMTVNLLESSAPGPVVEAVRDVQAARADEERARNEAESYHNDIIPKARGAAEKMLQDSEAYKQEVVARAQGDAARFDSVYAQYAKAPDVTKKRIYIETMEKMLQGVNKVLVSKNSATPYFPVPALQAPAAPAVTEGK